MKTINNGKILIPKEINKQFINLNARKENSNVFATG
jgi:hypothetical protein